MASYTSDQENSPIVEIEDNEELNSLIANSTRSKYDVIRLYLIDKFKGHTFTLSDGRKAIMDNSDAKELSHKANKVRAAQLGNLSTIIENAHYDHSEYNVVHDKFVDFHYYHVNVKYGQDEFPIWLNVGTAKNDGVNHIYSITNKKEDVPTNNGVGGPVGNHLQNTSSNNSISQNSEKSTPEIKKSKKIQYSYAGKSSNTAGEIEAYDVGKRVDFTPEQRKNTRPDVDQKDVLFADDSHSQAVMERNAGDNDYSEYDKPISIHDVEVLRSIRRKSINDFSSEDIKKAQKWAYKFYKELGVKSPFFRAWFGDWRVHQDNEVKVIDTLGDRREVIKNDDTGWMIQVSRQVHKETSHHEGSTEKTAVKYLPYIDDITQNAVLLNSEVSNDKNENSMIYHTLYCYTEVMGYPALLRLRVEELFYYNNKESGILKLQNIEEESLSKRNRLSRPNHLNQNSSVISISELFELVKTFDKEFKPKSVNEHLIDKETGLPKVFYLPENAGGDWSNGVTVYQNKRADAQPVYISSYFEDGVKPNYEIKDNGDVIVYDPGQVKSATDGANIGTFNRGSKKIRYSRKAEGDSGKSKSTVNIPLLNRSQFKIYTKENAEQIISSITYNLLDFNDGTQGVIKNKGELVDIIWERLNTAPKDKQGGVALDIADEVIKRIAVKVVYDDPNNAEYVRTLDAIRTYMRGFNLEDIKGELEHRFGKNSARGIMLAWGAKTGATGVSIEEIVKKLKNLGFEIKGESDFERFEEIRKLYKEASEEVKRRIEVEEKELYYASLMRTAENIIKEEKGRFFSCSIYNGNTLKQIPGILRSALRNAREVTGGI